jgi:predicted Zn-dependent peptidase
MKRILSSIVVLAALHLQAQDIDRTKAPKPGPAPVINIPDATTFTLPNGLKVFVVRNTKLPQVSATLTIDRNAIAEGKKAGMASMAGTLLRYGTTKMNKDQLDEAIDFLGASVNTGPLSVSASSLTGNFPKVMALMADVALRPAFSPKELEKIRKQTLSNLEADKDDPAAISRNVSNVLLYGKNHPYGEIETPATVKSVTIADIKKFYGTIWKPNIAYLVFVGDITTEQAKKMATQYFSAWPKGIVPIEVYPAVKAPAKTYIAVVDRPASVQSVINITTPVDLKPGAPDAIPASLMNTILGGGFSSRLMQNLREKYGFTYGARSSLSSNRLIGSFSAGASVRNEKTDSAIGQFLYELKRINTAAPADSEVSSLKSYMSGGFARSLENPATIADFALNIARYNLPKDYYRTYLTTLAAVSPEQVYQMANKYVATDNMVITIVGNAKEIAPGLEKYGAVHYFDMYGKEVAAPVVKTVAPDISGEAILKKAIDAYGGATAIAAIKDIQLDGKVNIMGQSLEYVQKNIFPSGFATAVTMGGMTMMKQLKNDTVYSSKMQGNDLPLDAAAKEEIDTRAAFFEENYLLKTAGYTLTVKGIEQVDGKDAYVLAIQSPSGNTRTAFYDVASGLKVQEQREQDSPMGKMNITTRFTEYKTFEGIKVPTKLVVDLGQFKQDIDIETVKVNQGLKVTDL